ncbi:hypothetical protein H4V95_001886 [Arthrobacter sp. CAN_C5]|nr:hypothetical protein [Arthrobacter sp. CAN_C5]
MFNKLHTTPEIRTHHQNSLRLARPDVVAYFLKKRCAEAFGDAP